MSTRKEREEHYRDEQRGSAEYVPDANATGTRLYQAVQNVGLQEGVLR